MLCPRRLSECGPHRPHGNGRAHLVCINRRNRAAAPPHKPTPRRKRPYDTLQPTQQWERRKQLRSAIAAAEQEIGCSLTALQSQQRIPPEELLHLSTAERERIRTVPSLRIPCEQKMIACKKQLAPSHATETGTFANGAYITDPVRFVSVLCAQSSFIAVGGDKGDNHTKLGITYSVRGPEQFRKLPNGKVKKKHSFIQHFAALLVYTGDDDWEDMHALTAPHLTPFTGDSAAFKDIFAVLQHLIDDKKVSTCKSSAKLAPI